MEKKIVKPSECEAGKIYKVIKTTYHSEDRAYCSEGSFMRVVRVNKYSCYCWCEALVQQPSGYSSAAYRDDYGELLEGPYTYEDLVILNVAFSMKQENSNLYCSCSSPVLVTNTVLNQSFQICKVCKKERK